jgi:hypothetical protein
MTTKEHKLTFRPPFYYLKEKRKFWKFTYWSTIDFSADLSYIEKRCMNLTSKK